MPPISYSAAMAEISFLEKAAIEVENEVVKARIAPVFDVFTQHLPDVRKEKALEKVLDSVKVIGKKYLGYGGIDYSGLLMVGLNGADAAYKRSSGFVEVAEPSFNERGCFDAAIIMKIGDLDVVRSIIKSPTVAADAVAEFYLNFSPQSGMPLKSDAIKILLASYVIPRAFHGRKTRELAYRLGNQAREIEQETKGAGLQHIYERTK
jgi:hypothetical protein